MARVATRYVEEIKQSKKYVLLMGGDIYEDLEEKYSLCVIVY